MKRQLLKFSIHQSSKTLAFIYFVIFALIAIPWGIFLAVKVGFAESLGFFLAPIIYGIFSYAFSAFFFFIYNLVAGTFGGIEFITGEPGEKEK
jgi:hypothetical protein